MKIGESNMKNRLLILGVILSLIVLLASCGGNSGGTATTTGVVTTIAGTAGAPGSLDATGTAATFRSPYGIATDGTSLFVADSGNSTIRKIDIASGLVSTLTGSAGVSGSTDGTGTAALFQVPCGIATDGTNLYVADTGNNTIRQVVISTGVVTTLAGSAGVPGSSDGTGTAATFNLPFGVTTDGTNLYVADTGNSTIRQVVISTGVVTTLAGSAGVPGSTDGIGTAATFRTPYGILIAGTSLFVADTGNSTIRRIDTASGAVTTFVGTAGTSGSTDGVGTAALFNHPGGITTNGTNLYVTDTGNNTIRRVVLSSGAVATLAGIAGASGSFDSAGLAARFYHPVGITSHGSVIYVADTLNSTIRRIE
jgi:sugar lactone lactonase YvrE